MIFSIIYSGKRSVIEVMKVLKDDKEKKSYRRMERYVTICFYLLSFTYFSLTFILNRQRLEDPLHGKEDLVTQDFY